NNGGASSRAHLGVLDGKIVIHARTMDDDSDVRNVTTTTAPITVGGWYYVTAVFNYAGDAVNIYVNAVAQPTTGATDFTGLTTALVSWPSHSAFVSIL